MNFNQKVKCEICGGSHPTEEHKRNISKQDRGEAGKDLLSIPILKESILEYAKGRELIKEAKKIVQQIEDNEQRSQTLAHIAKTEAEAGFYDQAKETADQIEDNVWRDRALADIATAEAEAGFFDQAKTTANEIEDDYWRVDTLTNIAQAEAEAGSRYIKASNPTLQSLTFQQKKDIFQSALSNNDQELISALGVILDESARQKILESLPKEQKDHIRRLFDLGRSKAVEIEPEEESQIIKVLRKELMSFLQQAEKTDKEDNAKQQDRTEKDNSETADIPSLRLEFKLINRILYNLDSTQAKALLLQTARQAPGGLDNPLFTRLLHTLIEMDTPKGYDLAVQVIGDERLPRHLAWLYLKKLTQAGYLDQNLVDYLTKSRSSKQPATNQEKIDLENQDLHLIRLIINHLNINPDSAIIKLIRERKWQDKNGQVIDLWQNPEAIITRLQEMKEEFDQIKDRDELVDILAQDKDKAVLFYTLYGGKVRFALVNSYNSEKFYTILRVTNELEYHPQPQEQWQSALQQSGWSDKEAETIAARLRQGHFPLEGQESAWLVRLDVSDTAQLESIEKESEEIFGKNQLGALLKRLVYPELLIEQGETDLNQQLIASRNFDELNQAISKIEKKYPQLAEQAEQRLGKAWRKVGEKKVLNLSLLQVLQEEKNSFNIKEALNNLENHRKALAYAVRQQYKNKQIDKLVRDERLQIIEGKAPGKLLRYMVESLVGSSQTSDNLTSLFDEWESHLEGIFQKYRQLEAEAGFKTSAKKTHKVTLRYLDKRDDIIPALRFADSAQCCFTSTNYRIEGYDVGNAEWISRLWKDPLSFIFLIEDNEPQADKRQAIGFVFGSFGLNENNQPVVLLNGVYMQKYKTDLSVQSILNMIENKFSRPLKLKEQFTATRHGGSARLGRGYSNQSREILRLRALKGPDGSPETKIYDDLNLMPNETNTTDKEVWWKKLE